MNREIPSLISILFWALNLSTVLKLLKSHLVLTKTIYAESELGVLLLGDISKLSNNLSHLPNLNENKSVSRVITNSNGSFDLDKFLDSQNETLGLIVTNDNYVLDLGLSDDE